ncbi:MAG: ATP--guanido phosphotransferase [bacterium]|nr:ATP--guanido phosphotransferase [bacterium]
MVIDMDMLLDLIHNEPFFLNKSAIFTRRMRLARNLRKYPFPHQMNERQAKKLVDDVVDAVSGLTDETCLVIRMDSIDRLIRRLMVERHIISPEFAEDGFGKTLIWLPSYGLRILVNEEDHLRICCYKQDDNSKNVWNVLNNFDNKLSEKLEYAFDREFGYLTSCLTNLGSALRISSIMFLPSLRITGRIKKIFDIVGKLGCVIRGFYGEGSSAIADFYQITSGNVLGKTESEICESFDAVTGAIEQKENESQAYVNISSVKRKLKIFLDKIFSHNAGISYEQAISGISMLLFGKNLGIIQVEENFLKRLVYQIAPVSLQIKAAKHLKEEEEKIMRLKIMKKQLREIYV